MLSPEQIIGFFKIFDPPVGFGSDFDVFVQECQAPLDISSIKSVDLCRMRFSKKKITRNQHRSDESKETVKGQDKDACVIKEKLNKNEAPVNDSSPHEEIDANKMEEDKKKPKEFQPKKSSVHYKAPNVEINLVLDEKPEKKVISFDQIVESELNESEPNDRVEVVTANENDKRQTKTHLFQPKKTNTIYEGADIPVDKPKPKTITKKVIPFDQIEEVEEASSNTNKNSKSFADIMNSEISANSAVKKEDTNEPQSKKIFKTKFQPKKAQTFYIGPSINQNEHSINEYIESYEEEEELDIVSKQEEEPKEKKPSVIDLLIAEEEEKKRKASNNNKVIDNSEETPVQKTIHFNPSRKNNVYDGLKLNVTEKQSQKQWIDSDKIKPDVVPQQPKKRFNPKKTVKQEQQPTRIITGPSFNDLLNQEQKLSEKENKSDNKQYEQGISYGTSNKATKKKTFSQLLNEASSQPEESKNKMTTTQTRNIKNKSFNNLIEEEEIKSKSQPKTTTTYEIYNDDLPHEKKNLKQNLKKKQYEDEDLFWGTAYDDNKNFPTLNENSKSNVKTNQKKNSNQSKIEWLAKHLSYELGDYEWDEIAQTLIFKSKTEMIRILSTFTSDQNQAREIANAYFSKFGK